MLKAVLFDMDGVIVDTEPLHRKAYFQMFSDIGIDVSDHLFESFTGSSTIEICRALCMQFNLSLAPETLVQIKRQHFKVLFDTDKSLALIDGVLNLIKDYYQNNLTLVLASSASMPNINRIFKRFDLNQYFKAKLSGADLPKSKPHPDIFIKAAQASGYSRAECMVIEDSTNGIEAAKAANIFCVGYNSLHSKNQDYTKADLIINDFKEINFNKIMLKL
ncbi:HAD family phosphatase [Ichthyenterobacterium sp. W332]|uniref:HAD family phosphatase n=1 Tax=Microcosmobacter mediterraneus TaxID=3075607 RepID=A0ABU2YK79_9FLAO|nr:HAD family phosphatase [Ichthyenterobacterium sp. W332]MDT0558576.1 HAD family phosphatase [Ichthyenterobacterium sp. W332]